MISNDCHYKKTKEFFDSIAIEKKGFYDAKSQKNLKHSIFQLNVRKKVSQIFKKLNTKNNLDVGCGNGDFTIELAKTYPPLNFVGLDFSKEAIKIARNDSKGIKNIKFYVGNILSTKFKDEYFDTVFCINVLYHLKLKDFKLALKELSRISKKNIVLEIKNRNYPYNKYIRTSFGKHNPKVNTDIDLNVYFTDIKTVKHILEELDFRLVKIKSLFYVYFPYLSPLLVLHFKRLNQL